MEKHVSPEDSHAPYPPPKGWAVFLEKFRRAENRNELLDDYANDTAGVLVWLTHLAKHNEVDTEVVVEEVDIKSKDTTDAGITAAGDTTHRRNF